MMPITQLISPCQKGLFGVVYGSQLEAQRKWEVT